MGSATLLDGLLEFIERSPTPYHAVDNIRRLLLEAGFEALAETDCWPPAPKAAFVIRDDGSIIAFRSGRRPLLEQGLRLAGTHTDSPCLRICPRSTQASQGYGQLNIEVYGGALLYPWFDRDLSLAGRVAGSGADGEPLAALVDFRDPVAFIPSLAIHLDREANKGRAVNAQSEMAPIVLRLDESAERASFDLAGLLCARINAADGASRLAKALSWDLSLYDTQPPARVGLHGEFLASARLDNLLSTYVAVRALLESDGEHATMVVCNDHEEVGSVSASGARGSFLGDVLGRLVEAEDSSNAAFSRVVQASLMLSIDNAHGVHPNFADRHDSKHRPLLNGGPVIKSNANQRYAGNSQFVALFQSLCERLDVPWQSFDNRADLACGSTIGPLTAAELGIPVLDIGVAQFAMHSIRELAGSEDPRHLLDCVRGFFNRLG